jgi:hypothetical protein
MIQILNPFLLYVLSFAGALGIMWLIKYSNNSTLRKLSPINNFRQSMGIILLTNIIVLLYLIMHTNFINTMLINPGYLKSSGGSMGGYDWNYEPGGWDEKKQNDFKNYKFLKEAVFVTINISLVMIALYRKKKNSLKFTFESHKKSRSIFSVLLALFSLLITFIMLVMVMFTSEQYFILEGG